MSPPDVVYVARRSNPNESLRLSLRSLRNLPHGTVWVAGYVPPWASEELRRLPTEDRSRGKFQRINDALALAAACEELSESFVYMNDDFFILEPLAAVPLLHRGPIDAALAPVRSEYRAGMEQAAAELRRRGVAEPLSYELHVPMPMTRSGLRRTFADRVPPGQVRTMLGNLEGLGGELAADVKVHGFRAPLPPGPFASTSPRSLDRHAQAGRALRAMFPEPSSFEREAA